MSAVGAQPSLIMASILAMIYSSQQTFWTQSPQQSFPHYPYMTWWCSMKGFILFFGSSEEKQRHQSGWSLTKRDLITEQLSDSAQRSPLEIRKSFKPITLHCRSRRLSSGLITTHPKLVSWTPQAENEAIRYCCSSDYRFYTGFQSLHSILISIQCFPRKQPYNLKFKYLLWYLPGYIFHLALEVYLAAKVFLMYHHVSSGEQRLPGLACCLFQPLSFYPKYTRCSMHFCWTDLNQWIHSYSKDNGLIALRTFQIDFKGNSKRKLF